MRVFILLVALICSCQFAAAANDEAPSLRDLPASLPAGPAESALPIGAVAHVRVAQIGALLGAINDLVMAFVPEQAVPPPLRKHLAQPQPLLSWIGATTVGQPLTPTLVTKQLGIAADRALSLTLYVDDPARGWVLALPIGDEQALGELLGNALSPRSWSVIDIGGAKGWQIVGTNQSLPGACFALRSTDTLYLFGSAKYATEALANGGKHLADDAVIAAMPAGDVALAFSAAPLKPYVAMMAKQFGTLPPRAIAQWRKQILRAIGPDAVSGVNLQLRVRTGLADVNQALDYAECLVTASAETLVPALAKALMDIDGASVGLRLGGDRVRVQIALQAQGIEHLAGQPLPLAAVRAALASLPGDRLMIAAAGRAPAAQPSQVAAAWTTSLTQKLAAKQLPGGMLLALASFWRDVKPDLELDTEVPWLLTTDCQPLPVLADEPTLERFAQSWQKQRFDQPALIAFPKQADGFLEKHLAARAARANANDDLFTRLMRDAGQDERWVDPVARFRAEPRPGKPTKLVYESAWVTHAGLLSYSQHELVNRTIWYAAQRGDLELMQRVQGDTISWLDQQPVPAKPLPAGVDALFDQVEEGSDSLQIARVLPLVPRLAAEFARLERSARAELDAYIVQATKVINANQGDQQGLVAKLMQVPMPVLVASLNIGADHQLYCVLPGNLRYPRPLAAPVADRLLAGFLAKAEDVGGLVASSRATPGRYTLTVTQDLRGLATLVKSTGNALWKEFLGAPEPLEKLRAALGAPGDGEPNDNDTVIIYSQLWPRAR